MNQPCASAESQMRRPALRLGLLSMGAALMLWGAYLLYKDHPALAVPAIIIFGGAALAWEVLIEKRLPRYEISTLWVCREDDCRGLDNLRRVELDWYRINPLSNWTPALRLQVGSETWYLPLSLEGWDGFWDCLRRLRPDLNLPDWRYLKLMRAWLAGYRRYGLILPAEVEVWRLGTIFQGITGVIFISLLDKAWRTLFGSRSLTAGMFLAAGSVLLSDHLLRYVFPPRITKAPWLEQPEKTETSASEL